MCLNWSGPTIPGPLNLAEQEAADTVRATIQLTTRPDPAVVSAISSTAREAHSHGLPFDRRAVLEYLYPRRSWDQAVLVSLHIGKESA
jgi:hypothetical protein